MQRFHMNRHTTVHANYNLTNTSLDYWITQRHHLLNAMSRVMRVAPFQDESELLGDSDLLNEFCQQLAAYLTADYFTIFMELNPQQITEQLVLTIARMSFFYLKYNTIAEIPAYKFTLEEIKDDLSILSEELAYMLDLEDFLINNFFDIIEVFA
jgi:regulator of sigma D